MSSVQLAGGNRALTWQQRTVTEVASMKSGEESRFRDPLGASVENCHLREPYGNGNGSTAGKSGEVSSEKTDRGKIR